MPRVCGHVQPTLLPVDSHRGMNGGAGCLSATTPSPLQEQGVSRGLRGWSQGSRGPALGGPGRSAVGEKGGPTVALWRGGCSRRRGAPLPRSVQLRVVNVLITVLMSCKWNPASKYVRVMSSHLTNGDLIELLIGCLFPPRFMTRGPELSGEGAVRPLSPCPGSASGLRLAASFQGHHPSTFLQGKINSLRLLCLY